MRTVTAREDIKLDEKSSLRFRSQHSDAFFENVMSLFVAHTIEVLFRFRIHDNISFEALIDLDLFPV
jgi:hypothetical protein